MKLEKQGSFYLDMEKSTYQTEINRIRIEADQQRNERNHYLNEIEKLKAFYESKLIEKNKELEALQNQRVQELDAK